MFAFEPHQRFHAKHDFQAVFDGGKRVSAGVLRGIVYECGKSHSRLGVVVGRKLGKAHTRNTCKRVCREWFRLEQHRFKRPIDLVLLPASDQLIKYAYDERKQRFDNLLKQINYILG